MTHAAEALRLMQFGFHPIVERPGGKVPLAPAWQRQVYRTPDEVRADFESAPDGAGVGTVTHGFIVLDLDERPGVSGLDSLLKLQTERGLPALPRTLTSRTPSGGTHAFFRLPAGVRVKNSASKLGPGIDVRGEGGQVVLPPTQLGSGQAYRWQAGCAPGETDMAVAPQLWLALICAEPESAPTAPALGGETLRRPGDREHAKERARLYLEQVEPAVAGQGGHDATFRAACRVAELCVDPEDVLEVMLPWSERCTPPWSRRELEHKVRDALNTVQLGSRFDAPPPAADPEAPAPPPPAGAEDVAWVEEMQAYVVRDRRTGVWNLANPLNERAAVGALVSRGIPAPEARRLLKDWAVTYASRIECDPDSPPTFELDGVKVLNNYVPPRVAPARGEWPVLSEVLDFITAGDASGRRWLMNWLANAYQFPARPMRTVPVFYGAQRTGKSLLSRVMTTLLGPENCASVRNEDIHGRFNVHFVGKLFITVGEIETADVAAATATLKWLTGEPYLMAEAKGSTAFQVKNRVKMLCTSNQTLPVNVEGQGDSRFSLFKQLLSPALDYQARMDSLFDPRDNSWSERGLRELAAFAQALREWAVDAELARSVHCNEARAVAVEASRSSVEQFVETVKHSSLDAVWLQYVPEHERQGPAYLHMDLPGAPGLTGSQALYQTYRAFCRGSGLQPLGMGRFPGELERHAPLWTRARLGSGSRPWVYEALPRDRAGRQQYLPFEMRNGALPPSDPNAPAIQRAREALQQAFPGMQDEEDES